MNLLKTMILWCLLTFCVKCKISASITASITTTATIGDPSVTATTPSVTPLTDSSKSISPEAAAVLVAVTVPVVVIAIVLLCFFQIQKHWKMRQAQIMAVTTVDANVEPSSGTEHVQLYLQNKAEMSAEQSRCEMDSEHEVYELMNRDQYQEVPGEAVQQPMLSLGEVHELHSEDHARELDSSQNQGDPLRYSFDEPDFEDSQATVLTLYEYT